MATTKWLTSVQTLTANIIETPLIKNTQSCPMEESQCQKKEELQTQITRVKQSIVELLEAKAEIALIMMSPIANMNTIPALCAGVGFLRARD